jgi:hypothetical protein
LFGDARTLRVHPVGERVAVTVLYVFAHPADVTTDSESPLLVRM